MIILTDRLNEGRSLQQTLGAVQRCTLLSLQQATAQAPMKSLIVCDVAFDNEASLELLRTALRHHRDPPTLPVLCLLRDPSQLTLAQAKSIAPSALLPYNSPRPLLHSTIRQLIGSPAGGGDRGVDEASEADRQRLAEAQFREAAAVVGEMFNAVKHHQAVPPAAIARGAHAVMAAVAQAKMRAWLNIVWKYDDSTYQHCLLVAGLAAAFSLKLGLSLGHQRLLCQAALVHDIGKAQVPYSILSKPSQLTPAEMIVMRTHPAAGHKILSAQAGFDLQMLDVVRHHHEYLDGTGYPDSLSGQQISQFVRVITICDIYAALIERRAYKAPATSERALSILADMGGKLDVSLLKAFQEVVLEG